MATVRLNAHTRTETGKQGAKHTRARGDVPAVLYGEKQDNITLAFDAHDFRVALSTPAGRNVILQVAIDGGDAVTRAVIREMVRDPVTRNILHVDLQRISENKPVVMRVPVVLVGESLAVKEGRGILDHTMRQLEIKCLPRHIPSQIEVDINTLEVRHAIHVSDIQVADVEILDKPERPVVEVLQPTIYREPVAEEAVGEEVPAAEAEGEVEAAPSADEGAEEKSES
jgi:large subunit ribosomal protein L25